jgi:hypothetical protein
MVRATRVGAGPAAGKGDSGVPVLALNNLSQQHIALAKGAISAGADSLGPCQLSSKCFKTVYYADITKTLAYYTAAGLAPSLMLG